MEERDRAVSGLSGRVSGAWVAAAWVFTIALAYVRNAFSEAGTKLFCEENACTVADLPFEFENLKAKA